VAPGKQHLGLVETMQGQLAALSATPFSRPFRDQEERTQRSGNPLAHPPWAPSGPAMPLASPTHCLRARSRAHASDLSLDRLSHCPSDAPGSSLALNTACVLVPELMLLLPILLLMSSLITRRDASCGLSASSPGTHPLAAMASAPSSPQALSQRPEIRARPSEAAATHQAVYL